MQRTQKSGKQLQVLVRDNNVEQALRVLKKKMQREGVFREMKARRSYEKPSEKRVREKAEAVRRARKAARKQAQREGLLPMPKKKLEVGAAAHAPGPEPGRRFAPAGPRRFSSRRCDRSISGGRVHSPRNDDHDLFQGKACRRPTPVPRRLRSAPRRSKLASASKKPPRPDARNRIPTARSAASARRWTTTGCCDAGGRPKGFLPWR